MEANLIDELLALDLLTLREHTERAGDAMEPAQQREQLCQSLAQSRLCSVRREGRLIAYAMLRPADGMTWFVGGFNTDPAHRSAPVLRELFAQVAQLLQAEGASELCSHVYKTNALSLAFHRRLGFRVTRESDKAVEFRASVAELMASPALRRAAAEAAT
ncbi:GNAT family N-acetyltransferase [Paucibacter sp. APW11]|uniref:GNAT family N-acetyltransferase n=1 Tax=Roseateles aquae TaxID=3077235 RepID=A0ABU3PCJ2_9BURK|nr:GNAT family N-acetyltransferase [Paucibacter sp. APW11]MDT9000005.1 GNAT family N-acetyltransferase [Paucibacter sp. APW11]